MVKKQSSLYYVSPHCYKKSKTKKEIWPNLIASIAFAHIACAIFFPIPIRPFEAIIRVSKLSSFPSNRHPPASPPTICCRQEDLVSSHDDDFTYNLCCSTCSNFGS